MERKSKSIILYWAQISNEFVHLYISNTRLFSLDDLYVAEGEPDVDVGNVGLQRTRPEVGDEVLRAGDLLKYLMAVTGRREPGSTLRFGFTK